MLHSAYNFASVLGHTIFVQGNFTDYFFKMDELLFQMPFLKNLCVFSRDGPVPFISNSINLCIIQ